MNIVAGSTNLESVYAQSEVAVKKLQAEWHRSFISINETLGAIEDKKARAEAGEKIMTDDMVRMGGSKGGGLTESQKKTITILVVIIAAIALGYFIPPVREYFAQGLRDVGILPPDDSPIE
jgi:hypothetical protein